MEHRRDVLSDLVIHRSRHLRFDGALDRIDRAGSATNPYCGDVVTVAITIGGLQDSLPKLRFVRCAVEGCALCKASADLMAECLEGCHLSELAPFSTAFEQLLGSNVADGSLPDRLLPLRPFEALRTVPARHHCALLPWRAMDLALTTSGDLGSSTEPLPVPPQ